MKLSNILAVLAVLLPINCFAQSSIVTFGTIGSTLTNAGNVLNTTQPVNPQTGTSYAIAATDSGGIITFANSSAIAATIAQATTAGFTAGYSVYVQDIGAGAVTITPATSTINGTASLVIGKNTGCQITSDGANYQVSACTALGTTSANSGAFASKPSPAAGLLYYATDIGTHGCLLSSDGSIWKPASGSCTLYQTGVQTTMHTGDTTETNVLTVTIPAGLLNVTDGLKINAQCVKTNTNSTVTYNIRWSSVSGGANGTQLANIASSSATKLSESLKRTLWNRGSISTQVSEAATNVGTGESTNTGATFSINTASAAYLNFTVTDANAGDTAGYDAVTVEWAPGT